MWHRKFDKEGKLIDGCGGRVFVDRAFSNETWIETSCVECGKRWIIDIESNAYARDLRRREKKFINAGNR